ncbi:MAG: L-aspartate oxidase [Deltaproteobacteria bacterium]|nr:L-aspartate oxidase [Deltaproteobacteria bacterium]
MRHSTDILVIGGGVAGLTFALEAAKHGRVTLLTKRKLDDTATSRAQGGIAAVLASDDDFEAHIEDTLVAGAGLCHRDVVEFTVERGPARIEALEALGARFNRVDANDPESPYDLCREGGHHARRVVRSADMTGQEVQRVLGAAARAHEGIELIEEHPAIDLITSGHLGLPGENRVLGAYALDRKTGRVSTFLAPVVVLATGGAGKVYRYTSNPDVSTGDGVAMAFRAGCRVANLEFFQFHPTCLFHPDDKSFLISEALRGEGGELVLPSGEPFMEAYHPMKSLAPRDIVARAIDSELKRTGAAHVGLDMRHLSRKFIEERFPGIHGRCLELGIDMCERPIPVVPAAHYLCGGVITDLSGRTDIRGLIALGETSCTGLHGANRLASNSLLEGLVFGHEAGRIVPELLENLGPPEEGRVPSWNPGEAGAPDEQVVVSHNWDEIRRLMWNYVGIERSSKRLSRARRRLHLLQEEIKAYYWAYRVTADVIELRNIDTVAMLIVECACRRKESRGLHYTLDHPERGDDATATDTILSREDMLEAWRLGL